MVALVRNSFRAYNARSFINSLKDRGGNVFDNTLYLGIGRPQRWSQESDSAPDPANTIKQELTDWADLMHMKRVYTTNLMHSIPKKTWTPNSFYDIFRHDWNGYQDALDNSILSEVTGEKPSDLSKVNYYTITPGNNVYVCLKNAKNPNGTVAPSTINPDFGGLSVPATPYSTTAATAIKYCSDGYVWCLVAKSSDLIAQFETNDYYPVQLATSSMAGASLDQYNNQVSGAAYKGGIYNINVTGKGSGYNGGSSGTYLILNADKGTTDAEGALTPYVQVRGDGQGLEFVVKFGAGGTLDNIIVTNPGTGYTWATVIIPVSPSGSGAAAEAILSPLYGLVVDPIKTLNAYFTAINIVIFDDENGETAEIIHGADFTTDNDYRKIMLIANPTTGGILTTNGNVDLTYGLVTSAISNIAPDDVIENTSGSAKCSLRVVDVYPSTLIRAIQTYDDANSAIASNSNVVTGSYIKAGGSATVTAVNPPGADFGSGDVIYADYRRPVMRAPGQSEEFRIVLEW